MRYTINLATRTIYDHRLINLVLAAIITILAVLLAWNIFRFSRNQGELSRLNTDITTEEKRRNSRPAGVSEKEQAATLATIRFYNEIIERKTFGWMGLLEQMESATPEGIALTSFSIDKKSGIVNVEGLAQDFKKVQAYLDNLTDSRYFSDVQLLSNKNKVLWEQAKGVVFSMSFRVRAQ